MLCQEDDEKRLRLVVCMSRKLNKHEVNYPVHEKELIALVESTIKGRHYLHGLPVIVYTDSSALKYLQTMAKPSPPPDPMVAPTTRVRSFHSPYPREDEHCRGHLNQNA